MVKFVAAIIRNSPKDRIATRMEFEGRYDNPELNIWTAISSYLRNWIIQAIPKQLDNAINVADRSKTEVKKVTNK